MITKKEKEALFEEFKLRIQEEQKEHSATYLKKHNLKPAREHFDELYKNYRKTLKNSDVETANVYIWPLISTILCRGCDTEYIHRIKPARLELANEYGKKIVDLYFEFIAKVRAI